MPESLSACSIKLCLSCELVFNEITAGITLVLAPLPNVVMQGAHKHLKVHKGDNTNTPFPRCKRNGRGWNGPNFVPTKQLVNCRRCLVCDD
jgi:hypothetical protein